MCDELKLIFDVCDLEYFVIKVDIFNGVYVVLVFMGLGVLYWDVYVCGIIVGLICGVNLNYIICVMLESIVY